MSFDVRDQIKQIDTRMKMRLVELLGDHPPVRDLLATHKNLVCREWDLQKNLGLNEAQIRALTVKLHEDVDDNLNVLSTVKPDLFITAEMPLVCVQDLISHECWSRDLVQPYEGQIMDKSGIGYKYAQGFYIVEDDCSCYGQWNYIYQDDVMAQTFFDADSLNDGLLTTYYPDIWRQIHARMVRGAKDDGMAMVYERQPDSSNTALLTLDAVSYTNTKGDKELCIFFDDDARVCGFQYNTNGEQNIAKTIQWNEAFNDACRNEQVMNTNVRDEFNAVVLEIVSGATGINIRRAGEVPPVTEQLVFNG